jgi:enterochelin esterase-like enzyme
MESPSMQGRSMSYALYTPPGWKKGETLPLVLFLHGAGDDERSFDHAGIPELLDQEIIAGRVPRVVILVPHGDNGFWMTWADGSRRYEDWVLQELMPAVARELGTAPCPDGCHVAGISMGGNGALRFALDHPELFASVEIISGPILDAAGMKAFAKNGLFRLVAPVDRIFGTATDPESLRRDDPFQRWRSEADLGRLRLYFARGTHDLRMIIATNEAFRAYLEEHSIPHRYVVFHGGHRWVDWKNLFPEVLRFAVLGGQ